MWRGPAALVISAVALLGQASPLQPATPVISGRVVTADTGNPVRNARVFLTARSVAVPPAITDAEGRFVLPSPRRDDLEVRKSGYLKTTYKDAGPDEPIEIRLTKAAAIAGRLTDEFGDPHVGVVVTASLADRPASPTGPSAGQELMPGALRDRIVVGVAEATTDDQGEYRLSGLAAGRYVVSAGMMQANLVTMVNGQSVSLRADGPQSTRVYYPGVAGPKEAEVIALGAGEEHWRVDFTVPAGRPNIIDFGGTFGVSDTLFPRPRDSRMTGVVRGRILRADGRPLPRAGVRLVFGVGPQRSTLTDDEGRYQFPYVAAGDYTIVAGKPGFVTLEYGQERPFEPGRPVPVASGEITERVDISLPRASAIAGRIVDELGEPVEGARVSALLPRFIEGRRRLVEAGARSGRTDDLGRYRTYGLQPGQYFMSATVGQLFSFNEPMSDVAGYAPTYSPGTPSIAEAQPVAIGLGEDALEVDFPLVRTPTARISGTAAWADGDPVGGGIRLIASRRSSALMTEVGAIIERGNFTFPNVAPGEYVIQIYKGRTNGYTEGDFRAELVTVNGADVTGIALHASPGSAITGRITLEAGGTVRPRDIELAPVPVDPDLSPISNLADAEIHDDGTFALAGINGPRRLVVRRAPAGMMLKAVLVNGIDVTDAALPFGRPEQSLKDVEVVLSSQVTQIAGTLTDDRARALAGASVIAYSPDRTLWYAESRFVKRTTSARDGMFTVAGLPPGDYLVAAAFWNAANGEDGWQDPDYLESLASRATRVMLTEGQNLSVNLSVKSR